MNISLTPLFFPGVVSGVGKGIIGRQSSSSQPDDNHDEHPPQQQSLISLIRMESLDMDACQVNVY